MRVRSGAASRRGGGPASWRGLLIGAVMLFPASGQAAAPVTKPPAAKPPVAASRAATPHLSTPPAAPTRVALLIGEGNYYPAPTPGDLHWPQLVNPPRDVKLVAEKLKSVGFDVTVAVDFTRGQLNAAIADFETKAANADDAVVYFAGHGFEYDRNNYIVPIDAPTGFTTDQLDSLLVNLDAVMSAASKARHVNIFFLDACRTASSVLQLTGSTKPYVDDVEFKPGIPVAVVYSTARGEQAFDAGDPTPTDNSPFAWYVAQFIDRPRVSLGDFFTLVNAKVQESTRKFGPQSPYMLSSLTEAYYFNPAAPPAPAPAHVTDGPGPGGSPAGGGSPAQGGTVDPLGLTLDYLAVTDEPVVLARVLADHTAEDLVARAERGDPMAAYLLGYMFEFGRGEPLDLAQARTWLEHAAASYLAPAQLELGYFLDVHGQGDADKASARALMEAAAANGFAKAQAHLADMLMRDGVYGDYQRGLSLYRAAAAKNYPGALFALATLKDAGSELQLAALAAGGDSSSRQWLCELAAEHGGIAAALGHCLAAAKAGYAISQARMAIAYHDGVGVAADADEARHWTRLALQQHDLRGDLRGRLQAFGY